MMLTKDLPLPPSLLGILAGEAEKLNPPQELALRAGLLNGKNIVVSSPTASGKTMIAEMAFLNHFSKGGKTVYLVPLKALASEKYDEFKAKYEKAGMKVAISIGDMDTDDMWLKGYDLIIASNEKMDSLLRHRAAWIKDVTLVISDEVHLLDDATRGPTLEIVLTRLRSETKAQLLALSATINNAQELADWLDASLVKSDYRPVKLKKGVHLDGKNYFGNETIIVAKDEGEEFSLCKDTLRKGKQALVFVSTRRSAEAEAEKIAKGVPSASAELNVLANAVEKALPVPTKQCRRLAGVVRKGVAFHHAGLVAKQRKLVEDAFRSGKIKFITATPTLCLDAKSKIWCGMEEISPEDATKSEIMALKGKELRYVPVSRINVMQPPTCMLKISTVGGHEITVTPNHEMLLKRDGHVENVRASSCLKGHRIATVGKINLVRYAVPRWHDFVKDNTLPFPDCELDDDIFYLIGVLLGDGYSGAEIRKNVIVYKGSPCVVNTEKDILARILDVCRKIGIHCRLGRNYYGTPQIVLSKSKWFREFLVRAGIDIGSRKYIHNIFLNSDGKKLSQLISGLFDTDGCVERRGLVSFSNSSRRMIYGLRKALLRYGIVSYIRKRGRDKMRIYNKTYETKANFEVSLFQFRSILAFFKYIGFYSKRKSNELLAVVNKLQENILSLGCNKCKYTINSGIFFPRGKPHIKWADERIKIIKYLGRRGESTSAEIRKTLGFAPFKGERRLDTHFVFINRKRKGNSSVWSLNPLGKWLYKFIKRKKNLISVFGIKDCPLCNGKLEKVKRGTWRDSDAEGDIFWDIIKSVRKIAQSSGKVYDIVLPNDGSNDHHFVSNGFIVHNSFGLNLPAWRVIVRDTRRFTVHGMDFIPNIEVQQMFGRAGRPRYDTEGEALLLAKSDAERREMEERYINGDMEDIYSKLAVEPVLRMHVLGLVASGFASSTGDLRDFFSKTLYAKQYGDMEAMMEKIGRVIKMLKEFAFLKSNAVTLDGFVPAFEMNVDEKLEATLLGKRVTELYIDPVSANHLVKNAGKSTLENVMAINHCLEMRPVLRVKAREGEEIESLLETYGVTPPDAWDLDYEEFLDKFKTSLMFLDWMDERSEDALMEKYAIAPGELHSKKKNAGWLLYAARELAILKGDEENAKELNKTRLRMHYGVKEELLRLVMIKGIGRVKARALFRAGVKRKADVKKLPRETLERLIGRRTAERVMAELNVQTVS